MSTFSQTVGQRVRAARTERGLSRDELAVAAGRSSAVIGTLERGTPPRLSTLEAVCSVLDLSLGDVFADHKPVSAA